MMTRKVTDDDHFINLSSSAQALYLHLSMSADDDGFCNQVAVCMFRAHASTQDLQALLENRYLLQFENGVLVIKHWRMANSLRKDRHTPTAFQEELARLDLKENGSYTLKNDGLPDGCQMVANCLPQIKLDKNSIDKDINTIVQNPLPDEEESTSKRKHSEVIEERFEQFWKIYPRKQGKGDARKVFAKINPSENLLGQMMTAVLAASASVQWKRDNGQFIPLPATWLRQERWDDEVDPDLGKPDPKQTFPSKNRFANFEQRPSDDEDDALGTAWLKKG